MGGSSTTRYVFLISRVRTWNLGVLVAWSEPDAWSEPRLLQETSGNILPYVQAIVGTNNTMNHCARKSQDSSNKIN